MLEEAKAIKNAIRETLSREGIEKVRVIIFGSRARGDFQKSSDWDLLVLIDTELSPSKRKEIWNILYGNLHNLFPHYSFDILIKNSTAFEEEKLVVNTIAHEACLEGIEV